MKKLITVIIPAYNEEQTLPDIIKRLEHLGQSVPDYNFEFLFVNDGSREKTPEILQDLPLPTSASLISICHVILVRKLA